MITKHHTVKAYDDDLKALSDITLNMLEQARAMLEISIDALTTKNAEKAQSVIPKDDAVDKLESSGDDLAIRIIATRQPMGHDLRMVISTIKVNNDIERVADYASNIAKRIKKLITNKNSNDPCIDQCTQRIIVMAKDVENVGARVTQLITNPSAKKAIELRKNDATINAHYADNVTEISKCMQKNTQHVQACTHFIFIAKELERIGDHFKNIAESVYYRVEGVELSKKIS